MLEFDVSLLQIQVFLAVAEQHSFSKAAEQVNLEQSTVSRRIGVLERELGVRQQAEGTGRPGLLL